MVHNVEMMARLPFGQGKIGLKYPLTSPEAEQAFAESLDGFVEPLTVRNTAGCVDERTVLSLADGTDDPEALKNRVEYQLPGGLYLATTKALVAADATATRDATSFTDAYRKVTDVMNQLGYEDGGHAGCGASKCVRDSVASQLPMADLMATLPVLSSVDERTRQVLELNARTKADRFANGFYDDWSNEWHEAHLRETVPHNFASLRDDPDDHETHGHYASGALIISDPASGFAKNRFNAETGRMAFAYTPAIATEVAGRLAVSDEERERIILAFGDDAASVFNNLVARDLPVFAEHAAVQSAA